MQNRPKNKTQCSVFLKYTRITPAFATPITQTNVKISALYRIQAKESDPHFQMSHVFTSIQNRLPAPRKLPFRSLRNRKTGFRISTL